MAHSITVRLNKPAREFQAGENIGFNIRAGVQYYDRQTKKKEWRKQRMSDICFEGLKILVMVAVLVLTRYVLPWVKSKADSEKLNLVTQWAYKAVLMVQQTMKTTDGKEKKVIVTQFLKEILQEKNITLSDAQIEILIEAAVKQIKLQENAGIVIEATDDVEV